jgi:PAT family acetyl-CoA transporter-like MFS transporter 1
MADSSIIQRNIEEVEMLTLPKSALPVDDHQPSSISRAEYKAIITLTLLYFIQGIPLGMWAEAFQLLLVEAGLSYQGLAIVSWVTIPFSLKMLTAPLLDTFYNARVG